MPEALRKAVVAHPRYQAAYAAMPGNEDHSEQSDFKRQLRRAETEPGIAIENFPSGAFGSYQQVALEHFRVRGEQVGQATLRRGYVIAGRVEADPRIEAGLPGPDREALGAYRQLRSHSGLVFGGSEQAQFEKAAEDSMFGAVQLTDTPDALLDPNMEASFMAIRLRKAAGLGADKSLSEWTGSTSAVEALAQFEALFTTARPGGMSRGDLAQLAEIYYRAMRAIEASKAKDRAENESLAEIAATVAGVVVAVGVTILSAGTLAPVAAAALAGISAGAASALAGAAVRDDDSVKSVLKDFGTGAVEGVASVAGAGLAARVVRGTSAGVSAGRAAANAGRHAVARTTGGRGAAVAEAAIDGAIGGAAGDLFQTAIDESTWNLSVGEALRRCSPRSREARRWARSQVARQAASSQGSASSAVSLTRRARQRR